MGVDLSLLTTRVKVTKQTTVKVSERTNGTGSKHQSAQQ